MNKLFTVQKNIGVIKKDKKNPFYNSSYFDINSLLGILKPLLEEEGLLLEQPLVYIEGMGAGLRTKIVDSETAEVLVDDTVPLPKVEDAQKMGSAITYFRRYALQSLFALEAEDDDGNASVPKKAVVHADAQEPFSKGLDMHTEEQVLCEECGNIMVYKTGEKNGKVWKGYFCPTKGHQVKWVK